MSDNNNAHNGSIVNNNTTTNANTTNTNNYASTNSNISNHNHNQHRRLIDRLRDNDKDLESLILWQGSSNLLSYNDLFLELINGLKLNTSVKNVDIELIRLVGLSEKHKIMFFETIGKLQNLEDLFLRNYSHDFQLEVNVLSYALYHSKNLISLRLFAVKLHGNKEDFINFGNALSTLTNLKMFEFYFAGAAMIELDTFVNIALSKLPALETIRIKSLCLGDRALLSTQSVNLLCHSFSRTLKELTLRYLALGDEQIQGVIDALKYPQQSEEQPLNSNRPIQQSPLITNSNSSSSNNSLRQNATISIDNDQDQHIAITENNNYISSGPDENDNNDIVATSSLEYVELQGNQLCNPGIIRLANEVLFTNNTLIHLDLSRNHIGDDAVICIANALKVNTTLKHLNLMNNNNNNNNSNNTNNMNNTETDTINDSNTNDSANINSNSYSNKFTIIGYLALADMLEHYNFTIQELKLDFPIKGGGSLLLQRQREKERNQELHLQRQQQLGSSMSSSSSLSSSSSSSSSCCSSSAAVYHHNNNINNNNNNNNNIIMNNKYRTYIDSIATTYYNNMNSANNCYHDHYNDNDISNQIQSKILFFLKLNKDIIITKTTTTTTTTTPVVASMNDGNTGDSKVAATPSLSSALLTTDSSHNGDISIGSDIMDIDFDISNRNSTTISAAHAASSFTTSTGTTTTSSNNSICSNMSGSSASTNNSLNTVNSSSTMSTTTTTTTIAIDDDIYDNSHHQQLNNQFNDNIQEFNNYNTVTTNIDGNTKTVTSIIISSRQLLKKENAATREEWIYALIYRRTDLSSLFYFLRANPTLCSCK